MSPDDAARYHGRPYRMPLKGQVASALLGRRRLAPSVCPPGHTEDFNSLLRSDTATLHEVLSNVVGFSQTQI